MNLDRLRRLPRPDLWSRLGRHEFLLLSGFCAVAAILLSFGMLAEEVVEGESLRLDRAILLALRNPADLADPIGPEWLEQAARDITALGGLTVLTLVVLGTIGFLVMIHRRRMALLVIVSAGVGTALSFLLKIFFERSRPDLVPHEVAVHTASFPSSHAMMSAMIYLTLGALLARVQPRRRVKAYILMVAAVVAVLIGCSRVYLGVHWPTDVLAGWFVGSAWAMLCGMVAWWLQQRAVIRVAPGEDGRLAAHDLH
ncbi:MAG TPA: phosphatase PAP2 family protein [Geminicoccus sp.]|jgi:undecaprenyl-diphosphatase|uniref:phosphatase PAP2 family protein n=1 Tax=Geminicoccus sp. TaxID=2024832 RepID=UPI002E37A75D|nr:phosphatase PAP2 family protein [Geminicoccus sp.]HEX2528909.1 phosphatase PAP2 family protein [Geminicoccus sp.]